MPMAAAIARAGGPSRAAVGVGARLVRVDRGVGTASRWRLDSNASRPGSESGTAGRARMCRPSVDRRGERPDSDSGPSSVRHEDPPSAAGAARAAGVADSARPAQGRMRSGGARARSARWSESLPLLRLGRQKGGGDGVRRIRRTILSHSDNVGNRQDFADSPGGMNFC